jgi:hypothetical protein
MNSMSVSMGDDGKRWNRNIKADRLVKISDL